MAARWTALSLALILPLALLAGVSLPAQAGDGNTWYVQVTHALNGGQWQPGKAIAPHTMSAQIGWSMGHDALWQEREQPPVKPGSAFLGWSVLFTNADDGTVIYNGGSEIWDLNHPFDYYPDNPRVMNCLMTARWQAGGSPQSDVWRVNVSHDLAGGSWPDGQQVFPHTIEAKVGHSMAPESLSAERHVKPFRAESVFLGWSVLFTDAGSGTVIYDGGEELWNLDYPFDYYPENPRIMNCLMIARWKDAQTPASGVWQVNVSHDLAGGSWKEAQAIFPYKITANIGSSMAPDSLAAEKHLIPFRAESVFLGWSVLFTDAGSGAVIYDSGQVVWDLDHPFDYYPDNPLVMNCLMTARWKSVQSGGGGAMLGETLPDGRVLTRPFPIGTDPLPEIPPPADQIIPGTSWLTNALICGIDEGTRVPVYALPVWNAPIIDWVGMDDRMDYGMFLPGGWTMLYNSRWVEASGIGFITADAVDFPGAEE